VNELSTSTIDEMVRFNEAIDQALAESIVTYSARQQHTRDLFLAILGHDLRAPLSTITTAAHLISRPEVRLEEVLDIGARVKRSARVMTSMVADLLGYGQTQLSGRMPIALKPGNMRELCESAMEDAAATHPSSRFELHIEGDLSGHYDGVRLHQLLTNLFVNAAQYGDKARPVAISAKGDAGGVNLDVTNFGPPIPQASLQSIFKPLIQISGDEREATRPSTSLGLGLFVAREIAVAHGGEIAVKSDAARGTTFTVRIPRSGATAP
jgi:signal transduction histidine kinase